MIRKINYGLLIILIIGMILRFYNLNWGSLFYFHPDERNIAGSISRMFFEKTLNPHFFAYGSFWNYIVLFFVKITDPSAFPNLPYFSTDPFSRAIQILRLFSALQGVGTIIISYFVAKILLNKFQISKIFLILPFLVATSPGLIQASHFGTFESSLTFLYFLIFYLCLKISSVGVAYMRSLPYYILAVIFFGISISIKITSLVLFPILFLLFLFINKKSLISLKSLLTLIALIFIPATIFIFSNPFSFQQFSNPPASALPQAMRAGLTIQQLSNPFSSDFLSSMHYEQGVALGTLPVFYTQQFQNTTPILYQFVKILPYVLNPIIYLLFILSIFYFVYVIARSHERSRMATWQSSKKIASLISFARNDNTKLLCFPCIFFLLIFLPNSLLFVKWTRYIIPSLPYIYIFVFLFLSTMSFPRKRESRILISLISLISLLFSLFFTSIYSFDTRIEAANWTKKNLPQNSQILTEIYDMGIVPFNNVFNYSQIQLFNFYDLDDKNLDNIDLQNLKTVINYSNTIVLPSERISATRLRQKNKYPNGFWFYDALQSDKINFQLAKSFSHPYDKIIPFLSPDESFTVFDHPEVEIFTK